MPKTVLDKLCNLSGGGGGDTKMETAPAQPRPTALVCGDATFPQTMIPLLQDNGFTVETLSLSSRAPLSLSTGLPPSLLLLQLPPEPSALQLISQARAASRTTFIVAWSHKAVQSGRARVRICDEGASMVTDCRSSLVHAAEQVARHSQSRGAFECVTCGMKNLTEDDYWEHYPLFHVNERTRETYCGLCQRHVTVFATHLHNRHGRGGRGEVPNEQAAPPSLHAFALVVCRHPDGRYLLVQEFCNQGFWLPGGAVDAGESLGQAAVRETAEEAGVDVELTGVLKIEHTAHPEDTASGRAPYNRMRVIFAARPLDPEQKPKSVPDYESLGAAYVSAQDIKQLRLRGLEPLHWSSYLEGSGQVYPLALLQDVAVRPRQPARH